LACGSLEWLQNRFLFNNGKREAVLLHQNLRTAQRRMPYGILQQGSILISTKRFQEFHEVFRRSSHRERKKEVQGHSLGMTSLTEVLKVDVSLEKVKEAILKGFTQAHGIDFEEMKLSSQDKKAARDLVRDRYGRSEWNFNRKPSVFKEES
jgi:lipoate-protein ligase A